MKNTLKKLLHLIVCILLAFLAIYLFVFSGGWKLFEGGDPILLEIAASVAFGAVIWIVFEVTSALEAEIKRLKERVSELENEVKNMQ